MMPAQHFESGDFTFRNRFGRAAPQEVECGDEREARSNEPIIDHTKQSWHFSNATSALTSTVELNRSQQTIINIKINLQQITTITFIGVLDIQSFQNQLGEIFCMCIALFRLFQPP
ncbi:Hypothetical_protein [Hexamita inflata]|uniref:Hypothetical_protein n=1 Tax=Hexamita inflata TaxID=28002 RepID=A0ABP1K2P0_9EUKA